RARHRSSMARRPGRTAADPCAELAFAAPPPPPPPRAPPGAGGAAAAAASIEHPRWLAWAGGGGLPAAMREALSRDAPTIATLLAAAGAEAALAVHALPALHRGLDTFEATGRDGLAALDGARVADAGVLAMLRQVPAPPLELLRCAMLLAVPAWRSAWPAVRAELQAACAACSASFAAVRALCPRVAAQDVELVHALGFRGRAAAGRVWVGAPLAWNDHGPDDAAMWALHEIAVVAASEARSSDAALREPEEAASRWRSDEAVAIRAATELVAGTQLAGAHARWLARLSLHALAEPSPAHVARALAALRA
ncbi:MAG: hypothetical protein WKG00_29305, partial [Polyangiaceae bacterium]